MPFQKRNPSFLKLKQPFYKAIKERLGEVRQTGSLGHGTLKHVTIQGLILPLASLVDKMPRFGTCLRLVQHIDKKLALCPSGQDSETWITAQATKLHGWFLAAGRSGLKLCNDIALYSINLILHVFGKLHIHNQGHRTRRKKRDTSQSESEAKGSNSESSDSESDSSSSSSSESNTQDSKAHEKSQEIKVTQHVCLQVALIITTHHTVCSSVSV